MSASGPSLFELLPAIYRLRDADQGGVLENLFAIFEDLAQNLDQDVARLYETWFIETCPGWAVPYIGDLLRARPIYAIDPNTFSARAYVAHTLSYRRRKGTVVVLEQLARDVTGWPARAVEFFQLLATTQYLNHLRPGNVVTPDLRQTNPLELLDGPFEQISHTVDVRGIVSPPLDPALAADVIDDRLRVRGKYNIPNVGLFLWRLESYQVELITPRPVDGATGADGRYWFHPLGLDEPIFNVPRTVPAFTRLTKETNIPDRLRRRALYDELEERRQALVDQRKVWTPLTSYPAGAEIADSNGNTERARNTGQSGAGAHPAWPTVMNNQVLDGTITWELVAEGFSLNGAYFADHPVFEVHPSATATPVPPEQIMICDLGSAPPPTGPWRTPPSSKVYTRTSDGAAITLPIQVSVDPVLGRLAFAPGSVPVNNPNGADQVQVQVSYSYGFSGDVGGGPYNRIDSISPLLANITTFWGAVVTQGTLPAGTAFSSLTAAIASWNTLPAATRPPFGIIAILDSHTYVENLTGPSAIQIPDTSTLLIVSADWPSRRLNTAANLLDLVPRNLRPHLRGNISVVGTAASTSTSPGTLIFNGLLVEGSVTVLAAYQGVTGSVAGNLGGLQVVHSTVAPGFGRLLVDPVDPSANTSLQNSLLNVVLNRAICGPLLDFAATIPALSITDSIVDATPPFGEAQGPAVSAPGADTNIQSSTIIGTVSTVGAVGPYGVRTLEASNSIFTDAVNVERTQAGCVRFSSLPSNVSKTPRRYRCQPDLALGGSSDPAVQATVRGRLKPSFTSLSYGDPGYGQLSLSCADEIVSGGDDGAEMGAFHFLKQPQRDTNLRIALLEYLRFGLQAGIFYVT